MLCINKPHRGSDICPSAANFTDLSAAGATTAGSAEYGIIAPNVYLSNNTNLNQNVPLIDKRIKNIEMLHFLNILFAKP